MPDYLISGLHVSSEFELNGAIPHNEETSNSAVTIHRGSIPATLRGATARGTNWESAGERFILHIPNLAHFLIESGRSITVDIEPNADERDVSAFVLGSAYGILLHQRGALVLHGAAVAKDGRAIAICGASGAGKSTLAAALCQIGCSFATDDVCVVGMEELRRPVLLPDGRKLKLWKESIDGLNLIARQGEPVQAAFQKYYMDSFDPVAEPPRLSAIYMLRDAHPPLKPGIETLPLPDAMRALSNEAYRPEFQAKIGKQPKLLAQAAAIFRHAKAFTFARRRGFDHIEESIAFLCKHWDELDSSSPD